MPSEGGYDDYTVSLYESEHGGQSPPVNRTDPIWLKWRADILSAWAEELYQFSRENPQYQRLELYLDYKGLESEKIGADTFAKFEQQNSGLANDLREIFRLCIIDATFRNDLDIDMCISQFLYSFRSVLNRALSARYSFAHFDPDKYVMSYIDLFIRGIS